MYLLAPTIITNVNVTKLIRRQYCEIPINLRFAVLSVFQTLHVRKNMFNFIHSFFGDLETADDVTRSALGSSR